MNQRMISLAVSAIACAGLTLAQPAHAVKPGSDTNASQARITDYSAKGTNRATTEQFSISYDQFRRDGSFLRHFECDETHVVKASPKAFVKDNGSCIVTGYQSAPGTYSLPFDPENPETSTNWLSDYDYFIVPGNGAEVLAISGNIEIIDNGDGTQTWEVHANY